MRLKKRKTVEQRNCINREFALNPKTVYRKFKSDENIEIKKPLQKRTSDRPGQAYRVNPNATMVKRDENHPVSEELRHAPSAGLQAHSTTKQLL